jgi:glutamyl-tRNA reductase
VKGGTGVISGVSISHERSSMDDLEAASTDSQRGAVKALLADSRVEEAFVLQTCNRIEAYVVGDDESAGEALSLFTDRVPADVTVAMGHEESLRHLLRVAAGLESVVLGEDQILGQVRDAYEDARAVDGLGPILEDGVTKALHVGERARSETVINEGTLSLASAAVRLAAREVALDGTTGVVVGAGEMGRLAAEALAEEVDRLIVANRTVPNAEYVADTVDVEASAVGLDALGAADEEARVVVTATNSPDHVVDADAFADAGETIVVDLAQPRDAHPGVDDLPEVTVLDLDALETVTEETREERREAAVAVESMIDAEFDNLLTQYKRKRADRVISAMYESAERVKAQELETALGKLDLDDDEQQVVESMADAIVSQLLSAPTRSLRDAAEQDDWSTIHTALQLFDPNFGPDGNGGQKPPSFAEGVAVEDIPEGMRDEMPTGILEELSDD